MAEHLEAVEEGTEYCLIIQKESRLKMISLCLGCSPQVGDTITHEGEIWTIIKVPDPRIIRQLRTLGTLTDVMKWFDIELQVTPETEATGHTTELITSAVA